MSRGQDSFASLESDDEDLLLKAVRAEHQARLSSASDAIRQLEACEDDETARAEAHKLLQTMDPQAVPYLLVELWLQMRAMLRSCKAVVAEQNHGEQRPRSKLGTVALPTAQELQLPEFVPNDSSNESDEDDAESSPELAEETTREGWKAALGSTATTHQDLFDVLAASHQHHHNHQQHQQRSPQLQAASETEDDDAADLDVTATSFPLLTIHGDEPDKERVQQENGGNSSGSHNQRRSPSRQQPQEHVQSSQSSQDREDREDREHAAGEFIDLGTLPFTNASANDNNLESEMQATRERMGALIEKFSRFASEREARLPVVEQEDDRIIMPTATTDPAKRSNSTAVPDALTSNDDLNEEIVASLARLARLYGEDVNEGASPKFAGLGARNTGLGRKQSRFVDKNGRVLEDDDHKVYAHYFGAGSQNHPRGYSFTVPTAHELGQTRRASSASKRVRRKAPTPITSTAATPRKGVRSLARQSGNKQGASPLAQKPRRVVAPSASAAPSSSRRPAPALQAGRPSSARAATAASAAKATRRQAPTPTRRAGAASK